LVTKSPTFFVSKGLQVYSLESTGENKKADAQQPILILQLW
jgi:hypothetical protein